MSPATTRQSEPDQACADAVDLARAAVEQDAGPGQAGEHVGLQVEGDRIVTHLFTCLNPAYVGWRWAVTVTRAARARLVTVDECVLLPGPDSLLAPAWVPWTDRVRPGDLKAGDLLPARPDDERLVPVVAIVGQAGLLDWEDADSWRLGAGQPEDVALPGPPPDEAAGQIPGQAQDSEPAVSLPGAEGTAAPDVPDATAALAAEPSQAELSQAEPSQAKPAGRTAATRGRGRGRRPASARSREERQERQESVRLLRPSRVLSATGRDEAAVRWYTSEQGPKSPLTAAAPASCMTCGFMVRLSGPLGRVFGACANEFAPDDGKVVSVDHGCGAHSEGESPPDTTPDAASPTVDELGYDMLNTGATVPESVLETLDHELL